MADLYKLPPPPSPRGRRVLPPAARLGPVESPSRAWIERDGAPPDPTAGRLMRTSVLSHEDAMERLRVFLDGTPAAVPIPAPPGVRAWERRRRDVTLSVSSGAPVWRRQRLAIAEDAPSATVVNWSVQEPPTRDDAESWDAVLDRLALPRDTGGWLA